MDFAPSPHRARDQGNDLYARIVAIEVITFTQTFKTAEMQWYIDMHTYQKTSNVYW